MKTVKFKVGGMRCRSCEMLIVDALVDMGVKSAQADHKKGTVLVAFDEKNVGTKEIRKAILKEGYEKVRIDE
jgi:copper chaperone CopZ